ncbi:MAG: hypothetical protein QW035_00985 [Candidatus Anstonellales archaeon]
MIREAVGLLALLIAIYFVLLNVEVEKDIMQKGILMSAFSNYTFASPDGFMIVYEVTGKEPFDVHGNGCNDQKTYFSRGECKGSFSIFNKNSRMNNVQVKIRERMRFIDALRSDIIVVQDAEYLVPPAKCNENNECGYDQGCVNLTCMQKGKYCDDDGDCMDGDRCSSTGGCIAIAEIERCGDGVCQPAETIAGCPSDCFGTYTEDYRGLKKAVFNFPYNNTTVKIEVYINNSTYSSYKGRERTYVGFIYGDRTYLDVSPYILEGYKEAGVKDAAAAIRAKAAEIGADEAELALLFVQSINYEVDALYAPYDDYPKYPIETIVDGFGDCEDTTILLASLLMNMGHESVLVYTPGHVGLGVAGDYKGRYFEHGGKRWFYAETTSYGWGFGEMPADLGGKATIAEIRGLESNFLLTIEGMECTAERCILEGSADHGNVKAGYIRDDAPLEVIDYRGVTAKGGRWRIELGRPIPGARVAIWVEEGGRKVAGPIYTLPISI